MSIEVICMYAFPIIEFIPMYCTRTRKLGTTVQEQQLRDPDLQKIAKMFINEFVSDFKVCKKC
jgi:hypothetical protein